VAHGTISWAGGPVVRAATDGGFFVYEAVAVGPRQLLGEVIQLDEREIVAQVYEDTTGLRPGDEVVGAGQPLCVRLGPGMLGRLFDGLLRPLERAAGAFIASGAAATARPRFAFEPRVRRGEELAAGQPFGVVPGVREHACLVPPGCGGKVVEVEPAGEYEDGATVCLLETADGARQPLALSESWSVRRARPVAARLPPVTPMVTGQRILDTLFPVARGSRAALPGGFGTGKTILQESIAKWCDADVIVYVGCGERGNEMAEVLDEFPGLEDPRTGRPLMERAVIIANTSNMPVAAREASIYTAVTVAEYFRDQGQHVALLADSTSRWAEALREVSGRLGELPGESGYPAYLSSRLAEFYERAARVRTLGGREGSVTIIGAISPPAGDFTEPVTMHTKRLVRSFWALDPERAQARFFPAVHPLLSYSSDALQLAAWWQANGNGEWPQHRQRMLTLLEQQARLERMARIVGRDALPPAQQVTMLCADLLAEAILRQSSFSPVDRYCSPARQTAMLRLVMRFIELAERAVARGVEPRAIAALPLLPRLARLGEDYGERAPDGLNALGREVEDAFAALAAEPAGAR